MISKQAIEKAIEGGWFGLWDDVLGPIKHMPDSRNKAGWPVVALDPTFWQALGKALGWVKGHFDGRETWHDHAIRFYDLILTGGDTEAFWADLLNQ